MIRVHAGDQLPQRKKFRFTNFFTFTIDRVWKLTYTFSCTKKDQENMERSREHVDNASPPLPSTPT